MADSTQTSSFIPLWLSSIFGNRSPSVERSGTILTSGRTSQVGDRLVDELSSISLPIFFRCVKLIADIIATMDLKVMAGEFQKVEDHPLYKLFRYGVNDFQSYPEFMSFVIYQYLIHSSTFIKKGYSSSGIYELKVLPSDQMLVKIDPFSFKKAYVYSKPSNVPVDLTDSEVVHVQSIGNGQTAAPTIILLKSVLSLYESLNASIYNLSENNFRAASVVKSAEGLNPKQRQQLLDKLEGIGKVSNTIVLEAGQDYQTVAINPSDAKSIEFKLSVQKEICAFCGVPPELVGIVEAKPGQTEELFDLFYKTTILPLLSRIEAAFNRSLLTEPEKNKLYYFKFDEHSLLQLSMSKIMALIPALVVNGVLAINEARVMMHKAPLPGKEYDIPTHQSQKVLVDENLKGDKTND